MKKIYAKLTKERAPQFQIETAIFESAEGLKVVEKRPLGAASEAHVRKMYENYDYFKEDGKELLAPCELIENHVRFPFLTGKSFYDRMIRAAEKKSKEEIFDILKKYQDVVNRFYPETRPFVMSDMFCEVFGDASLLAGEKAAAKVNIDLTFDNIMIVDGDIKVIDYEWLFDFLIPVKFPVYRAIYAIFVRNARLLNTVLDEQEVYEMFHISKYEQEIYYKMSLKFNEYVEGSEDSYQKLLAAYKQPEKNMGTDDSGDDFVQVFWGRDGGFSAERVQNYSIKKDAEMRIEICIDKFQDTDCIRIDPSNWPVMIQVIRLEAESEKMVRKLSAEEFSLNVIEVSEKKWIFQSSDPQILVPIPPKSEWKKIVFVFKILQEHLEKVELYAEELKAFSQRELEKWKLRAKASQERVEMQEQLLSKCAHEIQLLKDKLAYIEGTTVYRKMLKKKVDSLGLWKEIE